MKKILILVLSGLMLTQGINAAQQQKNVGKLLNELRNLKAANLNDLHQWWTVEVIAPLAPNIPAVLKDEFERQLKKIEPTFKEGIDEITQKIQNFETAEELVNFIENDSEALEVFRFPSIENALNKKVKEVLKTKNLTSQQKHILDNHKDILFYILISK
ncbi:MAG: hypothetical protein AB7R69_03220 [Candidatus Babeliales bacterium]